MGKLNDLFKKIKGLFNKSKALPEGIKEELFDSSSEITEKLKIKEEHKMTEHENFVSNLKEQAQTFDLTHMPTNEAIAKALEEKGLNAEIAKNPEFQKQMDKIFGAIFEHNSQPNEQMAESLRKAIKIGEYGKYSFSISTDGNFEFKEIRDKDSITNPKTNKTVFQIQKNGNLNVIKTSEFENVNGNDRIIFNDKKQSTFNKDGLEMEKLDASMSRSYKDGSVLTNKSTLPILETNYHKLVRNADLLTAKYIVCDNANSDISYVNDIINPNSFIEHIKSDVKHTALTTVDAIGQYPNYLDCALHDFKTISEFNQKIQNHKDNLRQQECPQNGTEFYEKLSNDYGCIPDAITDDEKAYRDNYIKTRLESIAKSSPLIKKLAEQKGLIAKEENAMEQE